MLNKMLKANQHVSLAIFKTFVTLENQFHQYDSLQPFCSRVSGKVSLMLTMIVIMLISGIITFVATTFKVKGLFLYWYILEEKINSVS